MPQRIVIYCVPCTEAHQRNIEITEVTFWIDEDRALYFIANCDCGNSQTVKTSAEALAEEYHSHRTEAPHDVQHVM